MNIEKIKQIVNSDVLSNDEKQEFILSSFGTSDVGEYDIVVDEDGDYVYITTKSSSVEVVDDKMTFTLPVTVLTALRSVLR